MNRAQPPPQLAKPRSPKPPVPRRSRHRVRSVAARGWFPLVALRFGVPSTDYLYRAKVVQVIDGDTLDLHIDVGFEMSRNGRFRLAAIDCPELSTPEGRRARDFVYKRLLRAKTIVVKTQRTDLHGRYVTFAIPPHSLRG